MSDTLGRNRFNFEEGGNTKYEATPSNLVWDDLLVPVTSAKVTPGVKEPTFSLLKDDGAGSAGVYTYFFPNTGEAQIFFSAQMPHSWAEGTEISPHVHWFPVTGSAPTATVKWWLEYTIASVGGTFGNTTTKSCICTVGSVPYKHYASDLGSNIAMPGESISDVMFCRLSRIPAGSDDTYDNSVGVVYIDIHFQKDGDGSINEYTKG